MKTELFMESGLGRRMLAIMLAVIMVAMVASPMVTVAKTNTQEPLSEELTNVAGDIPAIEDTESTGNAVWAPDRTDEVQREQKPSMWGGSTVYSAPNPPTPNALIPIFFDDMESGVNGWTVSGLWHMVDNESGAAPQWNLSYSGNWSWWYGQDSTGDYNTGAANTGRLASPSINLTGYASATLTVMEWFETDPASQDKRWLQYNNGGGWVDIEQLPDDSPNTWINRSIDLTPYCGQSIQLGFNFSANGFLNNYQGWYIDDVLVGYYPYDVEMSPQFQANYGYQAQDVSYTMTINNTGDNNDTYDLSAASIWPVTFWDMANTTQIYNISVDIKNSTQFIVRVSIPLLANDGDHDFANIIATSQNDTSASCTVDVLTGVPVTPPWFDDLESGPDGWNASGLWHMVDNESGAAPPWNLSYSGNWSWWYGQDSTGDYNTGAANTGRLESPSIDLTGYASATLTFMEWFETDSPIFQDKRWLQYNNGGGWVDIKQLPDDTMNTWINRSIDLTPYCGQSIQLGFNFSANGFLNNYQGWYIDDVLVGYYPYDVEMSPQFQENYGYQAQNVSYTTTINNTGDNNDTYDLSAASIWPVTFWDMANTTQIYNISVDIKNSTQFIVRVSIPLLANDGDHDFANIIATSQNDTSASCTVDVLTGVPVTPPWFDDLESGGSQYVNRTFAPGTEWELGNASSFAEGPGPAHSPDNCWGTNLLSNYTDGAVCELMMPYINLTSAVSANLTFWHWYDIANVDGGRLLVSNDGGETWTQIDPEAGYPGTDINGNSCYNGQSGGWIQAVFNLSGYVNQVILITFRFAADSTTSIANAPGWYIDDLNLSATYPDTAAPTVISTTPADTATGVSVGTNVVVVYNESMNSSVTPTLSDSLGTTYTFAGWSTTTNTNDTATWTHADWPAATTVDPTVSNGQDLAGNVQVTYSWSFTTAAHTATATGPTNTAPSNVAGITITYTNDTGTTSVDLYYTTDGGTSWFLIGNDGSIDGSYAWTIPTDGTYGWMAVGDGESAPTGGEAPEAASYTYDGTQPTVDNTKPANGSVDVPINQDIVITFNETMDTSSVTFTVWPDPGALSVGWSLGDTVLTASHNDFAANTTYWVNITAAKDVAGNNLTGLIYGFNFTTGWVAGATATATGPIGGPSNNGTINITYSWTGNPTEVWLYYTANGGTNWTFAGNDTKVDGDFNWTIPADGTYGWIAQAWGDNSTEQKPPFNGTAPEAASYIYDSTPPTVLSTTPVDGATGVSTAAGTYVIQFSEAMNTSVDPAGNITTTLPSASWAWDATGMWLNGTYGVLAYTTKYYVNLTTNFTDIAGNALSGDLENNFTTGDFTAPTIASTTPADGATGQATNMDYIVQWSEAMNTGAGSVSISPAPPTPGSWAWSANNIWYNYTGATWAENTKYTLTFSSFADPAGNAATGDLEKNFTTGDFTAPTIISTTPADGATGVSTAAGTYVIQFSEAMNTSVDPAGNITTTLPSASWAWDATGMWLNGTYGVLAYTTKYYVNLTTNFTDIAGNALSGDIEKNFTTKPADTTAPTSSVEALPQYTTSLTFQVSWTADDGTASGVKEVELWFKKDGGGWQLYNTYIAASGTVQFTADSDGTYSFYTRARDNADNYEGAPSVADATTIVDTTKPVVSVDALPALTTDAVFDVTATASDDNGIAYLTLYYRKDGGTWKNYSSDAIAPYSWSFDTSTTGEDGTYDFYVLACDVPGNKWSAPIGTTAPNATTLVDTTPPTITSRAPSGTDVGIGTNITVTFSEHVNKTQAQAAFSITPNVAGSFVWNSAGTVMTFVPNSAFANNREYSVTINATGIVDIAGNHMSANKIWTFRTIVAPPVVTVSGSITGRVVDDNGNGISGATVTIEGTAYSTTTDADGYYSFENIPADDYTIRASKNGYQADTATVTVTTGEVTAPTIVLKTDTGVVCGTWLWIIIILIICVVVGLIGYGMNRRGKTQLAKQEEAIDAADAKEESNTEPGTDIGANYPPPPPPE